MQTIRRSRFTSETTRVSCQHWHGWWQAASATISCPLLASAINSICVNGSAWSARGRSRHVCRPTENQTKVTTFSGSFLPPRRCRTAALAGSGNTWPEFLPLSFSLPVSLSCPFVFIQSPQVLFCRDDTQMTSVGSTDACRSHKY